MQTPNQIVSRGIVLSPWWREKIDRKIAKLEEFNERITHCRVVVESPHRHRHKGRAYLVRVELEIPRGFVVVDREPEATLNAAIDAAFDAAERQLEDRARRIRHDVKHHEAPPVATVARLFPDSGYGFLETEDGREIYFHRNSVLKGLFDRLTPGTAVRFAEEAGEKGPQASSVSVLRVAPRSERRRGRQRRAPAASGGQKQ